MEFISRKMTGRTSKSTFIFLNLRIPSALPDRTAAMDKSVWFFLAHHPAFVDKAYSSIRRPVPLGNELVLF